jgi:hypothetical protein
LSLSAAAKHIGIERSKFIDWLHINEYIKKKPHTNSLGTTRIWHATPWAMNEKMLMIVKGNRRGIDYLQTKVTEQGLWKIFEEMTTPMTKFPHS